jgi:hypothetical protein
MALHHLIKTGGGFLRRTLTGGLKMAVKVQGIEVTLGCEQFRVVYGQAATPVETFFICGCAMGL